MTNAQRQWQLYVEGNALVADFPADMDLDDETFAAVNERFEELARRPAVDAHVSVLRMESSLHSDVFSRAQEAARVGTEFGIGRWVVVSADINNCALRSRIDEVPGVEIELARDRDEALEFVR